MKIIHVVGARPNFMKVAPIVEAFDAYNSHALSEDRVEQLLVHTGQHYDRAMSELFFEQLGLPRPDINLEVGSGSHGQQTGNIMAAFENVLLEEMPDVVLVVGDVNSTMACAIDAKKLGVSVIHVEAGLRSRDMTMPEEVNRIVTDSISDLLLTTDMIANTNLRREGISEEKIHFVGNVMIDTLMKHLDRALERPTLQELDLVEERGRIIPYSVVTMHRPANVDSPEVLKDIGDALVHLGAEMPVVFPVHPRSMKNIERFDLQYLFSEEHNIWLVEPLSYLDFMNLCANARMVLSDSGGIQEETTILNVPCITMRPNTERPVTVLQGTNRVVGNECDAIISAIEGILAKTESTGIAGQVKRPNLWDGKAAIRVVECITNWYKSQSGDFLRRDVA